MNFKRIAAAGTACLLMLNIYGCSFNIASDNNGSVNISKSAYSDTASDTETVYKYIMKTMESNQTQCEFFISDESLINTDQWLSHFPGIEQIHCEYKNVKNGINVVLQLQYWDNYPIVYAYKNNDTSKLDDKQKKLLDKYKEVLNSYTSPDNTEYDNEIAIHDYLVANLNYVNNDDDNSRNFNAYDALINNKAVCSGYTECFKTFMDMLGIENTTVTGNANGQNHIWNEVALDGAYYHVDVTWDDPVNSSYDVISHTYFNLTDAQIAVDHKWDKNQESYKAAAGTDYSYPARARLKNITSQKELNSYMKSCISSQKTYVEFTSTTSIDLQSAMNLANTSLSYSYKKNDFPDYTLHTIIIEYK